MYIGLSFRTTAQRNIRVVEVVIIPVVVENFSDRNMTGEKINSQNGKDKIILKHVV